MVIKIKFYLEN